MNTNREQGIDLMRIFAMLGIVVIHTLGHGGILNHLNSNTTNYQIFMVIRNYIFCCSRFICINNRICIL